MKLSKLSNSFLEFMVKSYSEDHNRNFPFDQFKSLYPDLDDDFISDALYLLKKDGLAGVHSADNKAYITILDVVAVRSAEESTLLKKGYAFAKEIRSWL